MYFSHARVHRFSRMTASLTPLPAERKRSPQQALLRFLCSKAGRWTHRKVRQARAAFPWKASIVRSPSAKPPVGKRSASRQRPPVSVQPPCAIAFLSPDFMEYRDFCKPKIGCFRASIGCFSVFLKVQVKFNLHNTVIKQTAKKSRMKIEADQRRNCAAVIKEYGKKHLRGLLQGSAAPCKADVPMVCPPTAKCTNRKGKILRK